MTEAVSEPVARTDAAQAPAGSLPRAIPGVPWVVGTFVGATVSYLVLRALFDAAFADHATALLEAQVWGWHTVFWGFCFALLYGVGSAPYLWAGQRTPGTWEDVDS